MESIIECKNLTHYYGKRKIYDKLSFNVPKGRILGLLGKNGTGKTTTINILSGYLQPREGECLIFGENIQKMKPSTRARIGLLIEGHVQYQFMNIQQIERFYSAFYPNWKKDAYYDLMARLKVAPGQRISNMSCGQRSQVALGLILAQDPELLVLDDFSLGLDPGYRRLFVDYLRDYARSEGKTVFLTSHIIQDMERLIDDCIIMDYGKILLQCPVGHVLDDFHVFTCHLRSFQGQAIGDDVLSSVVAALDKAATSSSVSLSPSVDGDSLFYHPSLRQNCLEFGSFASEETVKAALKEVSLEWASLEMQKVSLEDAFISMTGKY